MFHSSISPSYTDSAGPVITTLAWADGHSMVSRPPRVCTSTLESSQPRRMPATTAAQAPVPQASVSPAPRSNTRSAIFVRDTTCMKPALTLRGKRGCRSISEPSSTTGAVGVSYATADQTATAGSDYTAAASTLSWANGVGGTQDVVITIANDGTVEADETFSLQLSNVTGGALLGRAVATVTIEDNDVASTGTIALDSATYTIKENQALLTISATRSAGTGKARVHYATSANTATADVDYICAKTLHNPAVTVKPGALSNFWLEIKGGPRVKVQPVRRN